MNKLYESLNFDIVLNRVANYCHLNSSKEALIKQKVIYNPLYIERGLKEVEEALLFLNKGFDISFVGLEDVRDCLNKALKGIVLSGNELYKCLAFHNYCLNLIKQFKEYSEFTVIKDYVDALVIEDKAYSYLEQLIDQQGNIKKGASAKLTALIAKKESNEVTLLNKTKEFIKNNNLFLQESTSFYRNNRITFLVKNNAKNKFDGFKYGSSSSHQAAYVEPHEFVELNNNNAIYQEEIDKEIKHLLKEGSYKVAATSNIYLRNYSNIEILDLIFAKAKYGYDRKGIIANLNREGDLLLTNIAHPLIDPEIVITNTYRFLNGKKGIVISGSNTGGKTIALKTIGLAILETYLAIPLFAEKASVPFVDCLYVDMQDEQSIASNLSTFSSHLKNLDEIFKNATINSLILIDEIATGTDPKEAEALSIAILKRFIAMQVHFVLTTHYQAIKQFAYNNDNILLSSVGFDEKTLLPTFHYYENSFGKSNALAIANKYLSDKEIINVAIEYLNKQKSNEEIALQKIAKLEKEILKKKEDMELWQQQLLIEKEQLAQEKEDLAKKKKELENKAYHKLDALIDEKLIEVEKEIAKYKQVNNLNIKKISHNLKKLNNFKPLVEEKENIERGDRVRIRGSERVGVVIDIKNKRALVNIGAINIDVNVDELEKLPPLKVSKKYQPIKKLKNVNGEINLVGKRVDEALLILDKYLDDAYGAKKSGVKIIHGIGSGVLRKAIRNHLKEMKIIKIYKDGDFYDGGSAVTLVEFKNGSEK